MDIDGSSISPSNASDIDQNLLLQFSCMNTTDREELIGQMQRFLGPSMNYNTASFFLDMSNWNLQGAICSYLDYSLPPKLPSMSLIQSESSKAVAAPGSCFEQSWTIANTGIDQWPGGCLVAQGGGADLAATPVFVPPLPAGHSTTIHMKLIAPQVCCVNRGFFNLYTDKGDKIGDTLWAEIKVESETVALAEQLAAMPVPSSRHDDNIPSTSSNTNIPPPDDQMC